MIVKFKDSHEIEFKQHGNKLLAESVIFEGTELHHSIDELRKLKAEVKRWFDENAPEEIRKEYDARLPMWEEIRPLTLKEQIAYGEDTADRTAEYLIGDEELSFPLCCGVNLSSDHCGGFERDPDSYWWEDKYAVRLLLEEK